VFTVVFTVYATVLITVMYYEIKLIYDPEPRYLALKESVTYCASIDLYIEHGIECFQTSASRIAFNTANDRLLAMLILSSSTSFEPVCID